MTNPNPRQPWPPRDRADDSPVRAGIRPLGFAALVGGGYVTRYAATGVLVAYAPALGGYFTVGGLALHRLRERSAQDR
jgi:hypothetical protein